MYPFGQNGSRDDSYEVENDGEAFNRVVAERPLAVAQATNRDTVREFQFELLLGGVHVKLNQLIVLRVN